MTRANRYPHHQRPGPGSRRGAGLEESPSPAAQRWRNLASLTRARRPPSNRPTPEFERRHAVEAPQVDATQFRPGWRVRSRFDTLLRDGLISPAEYDAGDVWSRDYHSAAVSLPPAWALPGQDAHLMPLAKPIGFVTWLREQVERRDAVGAVSRIVIAAEQQRGQRFRQLCHALLELGPKGGSTWRRGMDLAAAEWRLLRVPQIRFAVDDDGTVQVLVDTERPLVRKAPIASRTPCRSDRQHRAGERLPNLIGYVELSYRRSGGRTARRR
jgi:hypothetical protein